MEDGSWLAIDAWRSPGDLGLCYFVRLDEGVPTEDDRADRRATLGAGQRLDQLDKDALDEVWSAGTRLTATERRITDAEGELWLVRDTGPVWAEAGVAEGATGALFRCLTRVARDLEARAAGPVRDRSPAELKEMLDRSEGVS